MEFPGGRGYDHHGPSGHVAQFGESEAVCLELARNGRVSQNIKGPISGYSAFSKTGLNIRKFTVHILLKPGLENFEHYFTSM